MLTGEEHTRDAFAGKFSILRELGAGLRETRTYAARFEPAAGNAGGATEIVVLERYPGKWDPNDPTLDAIARDAERLSGLVDWNLARVRAVVASGNELVIVNELVEGATYAELTEDGRLAEVPFAVRVRLLVDLLGGLSALHGFGDHPGRAHRGVHPANVVVGRDGRTRLVGICRIAGEREGETIASSPYVAPERIAGGVALPSHDLYGVGVLLWEALSGKRVGAQTGAAGWIDRALEHGPPAGIPSGDLEWAMDLVPVVKRAVLEEGAPFESAADMAAAIRLTARAQLATTEEVADFVEVAAGGKISERTAGFASQRTVGQVFSASSLAARRTAIARRSSYGALSVALPLGAAASSAPPSSDEPGPGIVDAAARSSVSPRRAGLTLVVLGLAAGCIAAASFVGYHVGTRTEAPQLHTVASSMRAAVPPDAESAVAPAAVPPAAAAVQGPPPEVDIVSDSPKERAVPHPPTAPSALPTPKRD